MKTVLVAFEKHGTRVFDISTQELKENAYLNLFKEREKEGYYYELIEVGSIYHAEARKGNAKSAERIIRQRKDYEYERVLEVKVE
jgi:hypothetical protein